MKRRTFLKGLARLTGLGVLTGLYTWQIEPFWLEFVKRDLPIQHLPTELEDLTLMQISDMHVGNRFDWHFIINSFEKRGALSPTLWRTRAITSIGPWGICGRCDLM